MTPNRIFKNLIFVRRWKNKKKGTHSIVGKGLT